MREGRHRQAGRQISIDVVATRPNLHGEVSLYLCCCCPTAGGIWLLFCAASKLHRRRERGREGGCITARMLCPSGLDALERVWGGWNVWKGYRDCYRFTRCLRATIEDLTRRMWGGAEEWNFSCCDGTNFDAICAFLVFVLLELSQGTDGGRPAAETAAKAPTLPFR